MKRSVQVGVAWMALAGSCLVGGAAWAGDPAEVKIVVLRYGVRVDLQRYPQDTPQQTVQSVVNATMAGDVEYLLAQLLSPDEVDRKFEGDRRKLQALADKATPEKSEKMVRDLSRQLSDGTWTIRRDRAWAHLDGVGDLSLERIANRWFMHNTPLPRPDGP
jgi:hypothetical protein